MKGKGDRPFGVAGPESGRVPLRFWRAGARVSLLEGKRSIMGGS